MSYKNGIVFLVSFAACTYFLVKYLFLIVVNANVKGFKKCASLIFSTLREEPFFIIAYLSFIIILNIMGSLIFYIF